MVLRSSNGTWNINSQQKYTTFPQENHSPCSCMLVSSSSTKQEKQYPAQLAAEKSMFWFKWICLPATKTCGSENTRDFYTMRNTLTQWSGRWALHLLCLNWLGRDRWAGHGLQRANCLLSQWKRGWLTQLPRWRDIYNAIGRTEMGFCSCKKKHIHWILAHPSRLSIKWHKATFI